MVELGITITIITITFIIDFPKEEQGELMRTAKSRMLGTPSENVGSKSEGAIENSVQATNVQESLEFTSVAMKVELLIFQLSINFSSQVRLWENGAHREDRRDQPNGEEVLEEDFEADLDKTVTNDG